jgi:hypothetical protein
MQSHHAVRGPQPVRLAYQPPANSTFLLQQISHQQSVSSTFLSEQTSTSHQPPTKRTGEAASNPDFLMSTKKQTDDVAAYC